MSRLLASVAVGVSLVPDPAALAGDDRDPAAPLDTGRVAVLVPADASDALAPVLDSVGLSGSEVVAWGGGWRLVSTPVAARSADGVATLVRAIAAAGVRSSPVFVDRLGGPLIVTPEILLRFEDGVPALQSEAALADVEILDRDWTGIAGAYRVRVGSPNGFDVLDRARALSAHAGVRYAEVDWLFTGRKAGDCVPGDPEFAQQWGLHSVGQFIRCGYAGMALRDFDIDAPGAWCVTQGDPSIIVAILDDGVQLDHPDLLPDPALAADVTSDAGDGGPVNVCDNHGTLVAGRVGALANDLGVVGTAPGCRVMSVRTFISNSPNCDGSWVSRPSWTVEALQWALDHGVRVTNNSNIYGSSHPSIDDKYAQLREMGVVHFAASGNAGVEMIGYPASLDTINAVGMTGPAGVVNANSNYGEGLAFVAPGAAIYTTDRTGPDGVDPGDDACSTGTSHASPVAAGVAALVLSVDSSLTPEEVEQIMRDSALDMGEPGFDVKSGWGMVNAADAVALAMACPADVNGDGNLNVLDFVAFQGLWQAGDRAADCDGNDEFNVLDFVCFQQLFVAGCE